MLDVGGVLAFDDIGYPPVQKAIMDFLANRSYRQQPHAGNTVLLEPHSSPPSETPRAEASGSRLLPAVHSRGGLHRLGSRAGRWTLASQRQGRRSRCFHRQSPAPRGPQVGLDHLLARHVPAEGRRGRPGGTRRRAGRNPRATLHVLSARAARLLRLTSARNNGYGWGHTAGELAPARPEANPVCQDPVASIEHAGRPAR